MVSEDTIKEETDSIKEETFEDKESENQEECGFDEERRDPLSLLGIDVSVDTVNLGFLLEKLEYEEIDLSPDFQRSSDLWTPVQKSQLIESILMDLPIPSFFFSEDKGSDKWIIIDGLQRLCALKDFCLKEEQDRLELKGLTFLKELNGKRFSDLGRPLIRQLKGYKVVLNRLRKGADPKAMAEIFRRVNRAGVQLTPQEIRNAVYRGRATTLLRRMVNSDSFKQVVSVNPLRMADLSFANRFVAFHCLPREKYDGNLDSWMDRSLQYLNEECGEEDIEIIFGSFDSSMKLSYSLLGADAFRRYGGEGSPRLPYNRVLFEVLSVLFAELTEEKAERLKQNRDAFAGELKQLESEDGLFVKYLTSGTGKAEACRYRFGKVKELIDKYASV